MEFISLDFFVMSCVLRKERKIGYMVSIVEIVRVDLILMETNNCQIETDRSKFLFCILKKEP